MTVTDEDLDVDLDDEKPDDSEEVEPTNDEKPDDEPELGPGGKKALEAERATVKRLKRELRALRNGKPPADDSKDGKDGAPDEARLRATIESEAVGTWKPLVVNAHATQALTAAGLIGKPGRLLNLLDLDEIDVDPTDGSIDGLDDQITELKKDYPHLFRRTRSRNLDASDKGERLDTKKMSASEIQAAQLRGEL